jgi:hypothetical protein
MAQIKETTIERIYREVTGSKMSPAIKRVLLPKRKARPGRLTSSTNLSKV